MRVLLISANLARDPYPVYPFGLSVVAAALKERGFVTDWYDPLPEKKFPDLSSLGEKIKKFKPDIIGLGIRNIDSINSLSNEKNLLAPAVAIAHYCKENVPAVPLILGGGAFSLIPEQILTLCHADYGIAGPGEQAFPELAEQLLSGTPPEEKIIYAESRESIPRAGDFPEQAADFYCRETHILPIQFKRGCPFHCSYCSYPALEGNRMRFRDPAETVREMNDLHARYPNAMLFFTDSIFNDPAEQYRKLLDLLDGSIPFSGFLTPFRLTSDAICHLAKAGMISAELGIDGATDETLAGLGKNFSFCEAAETAKWLHQSGIAVTANFLFGGPNETGETIRNGIKNILSLGNIWSVIFSGIRILPHTMLFDRAKKLNMIPENWNPTEELYYYEPGITRNELDSLLTDAFSHNAYCIWPPHSKRELLARIHKIGLPKYRKIISGSR